MVGTQLVTSTEFRVWVVSLLVLGTLAIVAAVVASAAPQTGVVLACRDGQGVVVARYTTNGLTTLDGELELSVPRGQRVVARCSVQ